VVATVLFCRRGLRRDSAGGFLGSNSVFAEAAEKAAEQQRWWMLVTATKLESNMSAVVLVVLNAAALLQVEAVVPSEFMSTTELLVEAIL